MPKIGFSESETVEFKESLRELDDAGGAVCSFANQNGGTAYIGIRNNGEVIGINTVTEKTLRDVTQVIFDNLEPQKVLSITKEIIHGLEIIKISVEKSQNHVISCLQIFYLNVNL